MKTPITPRKFISVLEQVQTGAPFLCVASNSGAPRVWTSDTAPTDTHARFKRFADGDIPTPDRLANLIYEMAVNSQADRRFAREKSVALARRKPDGYIARRAASAANGGVL